MDEKRKKELEAKLIEKLDKDPKLRQRFLKNPREVVKEITGIQIPNNITIKVVENTPQTYTFVLPQSSSSIGMSDEDLKKVAGGYQYTDDPW